MIVDESGRHVLYESLSGDWLHHDRRWRSTKTFLHRSLGKIEVVQGAAGRFLVEQEVGSTVECTVRTVTKPGHVLASGRFDADGWKFLGDAQEWARVPEYVLVPSDDTSETAGRQLLRIADSAEPDPLKDLAPVAAVVGVPESRLVVLAGEGLLTIWDTVGRSPSAHFRLASGTTRPSMAFRAGGEEMWLNDGPNMVKLETRQWEVLDAAGLEEGTISNWHFDPTGLLCGVVKEQFTEVLILDVETMLPVATADFPSVPSDAVVTSTGIVGVDRHENVKKVPLQPVLSD